MSSEFTVITRANFSQQNFSKFLCRTPHGEVCLYT